MVIKVRDPRRWTLMPADEVITFEGEGRRPIRLEVNAETHASFKVAYPDNHVAFLAAFTGIETIEFVADGPCELWVDSEGDVYLYTDEGRNVAFVDDGQVSFAKPHVKRTENEQLIYMQQLMLANAERRNAKLEAAVAAYQAQEAQNEVGGGTGEGELPSGEGGKVLDPPADAGTSGVAGG